MTVVGRSVDRARALAEFDERRKVGLGRFYTADDIAKQRPREITDVLRGAMTLAVVPQGARGNMLRGRRGCRPSVWLNGIIVQGGADDIDDLVDPSTVTGIEVYDGATMPIQFNVMTTGGSFQSPISCGAVVIWTIR